MSYANGTTHYNLPQTVGTDKRDWFDTNQAFADVDAALYGAVQQSASTAESVTALTTRVGTVESSVATIQTSQSTDEANIAALQTLTSQHTTQIADVKADALDMICAVDEGTAQVASVKVDEGEYFRYNDVLYIATANIAVGDTIVPNTNCRATNVATELEAIEDVDISSKIDISALKVTFGTVTTVSVISYTAVEDTPVTFTCNNSTTSTDAQISINIARGGVEHYIYNQRGSDRAGASLCLTLDAGDVLNIGFSGTGINAQYACNVPLS